MNCGNCGAVMELVESRRYFVCRHCGSFHFPDPIDVEGVRIVGRTADAPSCPVCAEPLAQALLDDKSPVHFCGKCRGVLMPRDTFTGVVTMRRSWASTPPVEPPALDRRALDRRLSCPSCGGTFETFPYGGGGNAVIDSCERCNLIWLDFGELRQIVDAPGRERGNKSRGVDDDIAPAAEEIADQPDKDDPLDFLFDLIS